MRRTLVIPSLVLVALAAPGCFATRAIGLGPDPGPNDVVAGDTPEVIYQKAQRLYADQQWKDAADTFGKLWSTYPKSDLACDAQFYQAESRYAQGKYNAAFEFYKSFLKNWPLSPHGPAIQKRIFEMGKQTIEEGQKAFFDYSSEGVDELDYLVTAFPHGDLADDALLYVADFQWRTRQTHEAIDHLHDLIDNFPTSEWALEARLRLAKAYRDLNRGSKYDADALQRSASEYRAYIDLVTADRARAREYEKQIAGAREELAEVEEVLARKRIEAADFYLKSDNPDAARTELQNVIRAYPKSRAAAEARERLGGEPPPAITAPETKPAEPRPLETKPAEPKPSGAALEVGKPADR